MILRPCIVCQQTLATKVFEQSYQLTGLHEVLLVITVCDNCGAVYQNPLPDEHKIRKIYSEMSNYTNPGRSGKPSATKIKSLDRQLAYLSRVTPAKGRAFQIGCSDGYTLHRFQQAGWEVDGIDPSPRAIAVAKEHYGLSLNEGFIEDYESKENQYDLIVLTHVLEHFVDPAAVLRKCLGMLVDGGEVFIEVPSLIDQHRWPTGYFTFEHLNFFSPMSMTNIMLRNGINPLGPVVTDFSEKDPYPIQMCHGSKAAVTSQIQKDDQALPICKAYVDRDKKRWQKINNKIQASVKVAKKIAIWGAGMHTSQLLEETSILRQSKPLTIVDADQQKWGNQLHNFVIADPHTLELRNPELTVVISSYVYEQEIKQALELEASLRAKIVTLYE